MIAFIRGILKGHEDNQVLLDVDGVGYEVTVPPGLVRSLPGVGQEVEIYTHLYVREDCLQLYGFRSVQDRALFRLLLRAQGIGPRVALAILDTFKGEDLFGIVARGDAHGLQRVPGVGAKSAQRLVLELKGKLDGLFDFQVADQGAAVPWAHDEASQALLSLGYSRQEVETVLKRMTRGQPVEAAVPELVRSALKELGKGREG
jgi:Holliday junction DNA helicase RuvA